MALVLALLVFAAVATASTAVSGVEYTGGGSEPRFAFGAGESPVAVWQDGEERIVAAAEVPAGGGEWSPDATVLSKYGFEPALASAGGRTIALWSGGAAGIEGAFEGVAGKWKKLRPAPGSRGAWAPQLAIDGAGAATVVWRARHRPHSRIEVATISAAGAWSKPRPLSARGEEAFSPQVVVDPGGGAAVVWRSRVKGVGSRAGRSQVEAATRSAGGGWSAPADLSVPGENALAPQVGIDAAGEATAIWFRFDGEHKIIEAASRPGGGSWSAPRDLSAKGRNAWEPQLAVTPGGEALAVWERFDGRHEVIQAATRTPAGAWSAPRNLSTRAHSAHEPQVAIGADGSARVVWIESSLPGGVVESMSRPGHGSWSTPTMISKGRGRRTEPSLVLGGRTIVGWAGATLAVAVESP